MGSPRLKVTLTDEHGEELSWSLKFYGTYALRIFGELAGGGNLVTRTIKEVCDYRLRSHQHEQEEVETGA